MRVSQYRGLVLTVAAACAFTHQAAQAQFVEKMSLSVSRTAVVEAVTSAALLKIDEIASDRLQSTLADPARQAKMSPVAVQQLKDLKNGVYGYAPRDQALQFVAWVNSDTLDYSSPVSAPMVSGSIAFSPSFNVVRISWANVIQDVTCQRTEYLSPGFGVVNSTFQLKEEAEYRVFRNGKLLTRISGERVTDANSSFRLPKFTLGPVSVRLRGSIAGNPELSSDNTVPVVYDFDPYQGTIGQPVVYRIEAEFKGCGFIFPFPPFATSSNGRATHTTGDIWLDSDGDSIPDFYPANLVRERRVMTASSTSPLRVEAGPVSFALQTLDTSPQEWQLFASASGGLPPYRYQWTALPSTGSPIAFFAANAQSPTVRAWPSGQCNYDWLEFRVVVTDSVGRSASATVAGSLSSIPWNHFCP